MKITGHAVEKIEDTTGILMGERYEFTLSIEVEEDDELHTENGLYLRVIFAINNQEGRIVQYHFHEKSTDEPLGFALEEDEEAFITDYCKQQVETAL
ncbi:DUF6509 family protein [Alkalihalobacterium elongatum]|uniref:DUF6509 family protein n=1 Tax=Alkalihalobacterium elongatum TaxID=2675466 RepID=UPI001C1F8112|nr:DUF6509 family protein [Alkalihalobacterium elongatum]